MLLGSSSQTSSWGKPEGSSCCSMLPRSPQKEDPRPGMSRRVLCRAVNSPGAGKPSAWVYFQGYCSDYFPKAAEFLLPWAPGRTWPLGSRSALVRAAPQHHTCEHQAATSFYLDIFQNWGSHQPQMVPALSVREGLKSSASFMQYEKRSPPLNHARTDVWPL